MLKKLYYLFFAMVLLASCSKDHATDIAEEAPVNKKVVYELFAGKDYSAPIYDNMKVDITLTVGVVNKKTGAFQKKWDYVSSGDLRFFPQQPNPVLVEETFPVKESVEQLQVAYSIRYTQNGQIQQRAGFEPLPSGSSTFRQAVNL